MLELTKLNGEKVIVNMNQIQSVIRIPETKIIFANKEFLVVRESVDQIINLSAEFSGKVNNFFKMLIIQDNNDAEIKKIEVC